jgi:tRNA-splicing ligase RtcB (3'-phosphate/5'-hydroxy nucleic acid ligase)
MTELKTIQKNVWEVPKENDMKVPAHIYANQEIINVLHEEEKTQWSSLKQLKNVAGLPGIQKYAIALPDIHPGYGAPIGSAAAFDLNEGVISFAINGFDINCGVRTLTTGLTIKEIESKKKEIANELFKTIPAGLGEGGELRLKPSEIDEMLEKGSKYAIEKGYGTKQDTEFTEENGCMKNADPNTVSMKAKQRMHKQLGSLGSGNHYLEIQEITEIYDEKTAQTFNLAKEECVITIHCGSRGLGHQIGSDYLPFLEKASRKHKIPIKDKELVCAPIQSEEGQQYFKAVNAGMNCAFANRQVLGALARNAFQKIFETEEKQIKLLYDVGHNTSKIETHKIEEKKTKLLVQRKGSTRGFGPMHEDIPEKYHTTGQPVIAGGSMGTSSYIFTGTTHAMNHTFGSTIHGAGRTMSRVQSKKQSNTQTILEQLKAKGILVKGHSHKGIAEEAPESYKNIDTIANIIHETGISKKTAKLKPKICIKG